MENIISNVNMLKTFFEKKVHNGDDHILLEEAYNVMKSLTKSAIFLGKPTGCPRSIISLQPFLKVPIRKSDRGLQEKYYEANFSDIIKNVPNIYEAIAIKATEDGPSPKMDWQKPIVNDEIITTPNNIDMINKSNTTKSSQKRSSTARFVLDVLEKTPKTRKTISNIEFPEQSVLMGKEELQIPEYIFKSPIYKKQDTDTNPYIYSTIPEYAF